MIEPFIVGYPAIHWSVPQPEPWMDDALCAQTDPEAFFRDSETGDFAVRARSEKQVCAACPVREQCLAYALENHITDGIYGGLSPKERRGLRKDAA